MEIVRMKSTLQKISRPLIIIVIIYLVLLLGPIAAFDIPVIAARITESPKDVIQFLIIGIANGAIIAIIALGYTMVYGIVELINFAHGDVYMIGVFTALTTLSLTGTLKTRDPGHIALGIVIALVVSIVVCAVLNAAIERLAYHH
jgi:branched-chain amino acid transport system permease protein